MFTTLLKKPLANGLILFYNLLGQNLGLAIIVFSIFLRVILNPLTKPYMNSMKKMKDAGPQLEKLKKKYKNDPQKLMKAQSDFYKQKGINPGAGCLPYIFQIMILIAFFNVFTTVLVGNGEVVQKLNELLYAPLKLVQGGSLNTKFLYLNLTSPDTFVFFGLTLPGPLLIMSAIAQLVSTQIMQPVTEASKKLAKKTLDKTDDMATSMQQSMIYMFPLMTLFIGLKFASGLVLYWLTFSLLQAFQQYKSYGWGGLTPWLKRFGLLK